MIHDPREQRSRSGILLLNPPFCDPKGPYLAIPQLTGYLKSRKIPVKACDLSAELYKALLTPRSISRGARHLGERFLELNGAASLTFDQLMEYNILVELLWEFRRCRGDLTFLATPFSDFNDVRESGIAEQLLLMASMPNFPEILMVKHQFINPARRSPYSSREILAATKDQSMFTRIYQTLIARVLEGERPRIVGLSVVFSHQIIPAFQLAAEIRRLDPGAHITMGGPAISIFFRNLKNPDLFDNVNSLVMDDGEIPLERLYSCLENGGQDIGSVPGLVFRQDGRILSNPPAPPIPLTDLPMPDLAAFDLAAYLTELNHVFVPLRLSRGCPWQKCAFCRTGHPLCRNLEEPAADFVFEQLRQAYQDLGLRRFGFSAESANPVTLEYLSRRLIKERMQLNWISHTRVSKALTRERCRLFSNSGCLSLAVGVESMSDRVLKLMKKGISRRLVTSVLEEAGGAVPLTAYMMVGFPTETRAEAMESFQRLRALKDKGLLVLLFYSMFTIQQESAVLEHPEAFGITRIDQDPEDDLNPDVAGFDADGMTREEAFELYMDFTRREHYVGRLPKALTEVQVDGQPVRLRFNPSLLRCFAASQWQTFVTPFGKWMDDQAGRPVDARQAPEEPGEMGER